MMKPGFVERLACQPTCPPNLLGRRGKPTPLQSLRRSQGWRRQAQKGFTLMELLVVIAIIVILTSILMSALSGVRTQSKKTETTVFTLSLGMALKSYYNEYGFWPSTPTPPTADAELTTDQAQNLYLMLSGQNIWLDGTAGGNPRGIKFLEYKPANLGPVDTAYLQLAGGSTTNLVNSWRNGYRVSFDYDGNNYTTNTFNASPGILERFTIWSVGLPANTYTNMSWK